MRPTRDGIHPADHAQLRVLRERCLPSLQAASTRKEVRGKIREGDLRGALGTRRGEPAFGIESLGVAASGARGDQVRSNAEFEDRVNIGATESAASRSSVFRGLLERRVEEGEEVGHGHSNAADR